MTKKSALNLTKAVLAYSLMFQVPRIASQTATYDQPFRPQVHFSPQEHWTNDPNGLVFFEGEYHLFYQYNPFGDQWGHMSWGHAVSIDLLHWKELPVAIPEANGEMIFTGSVVIDEHNTSGLCLHSKPCMVAIYTGHRGEGKAQRESQDIAASQDLGRTWQIYVRNPVLDLQMTDFRDPSVTWNEESHAWLMAVSMPNEHKVAFYTSPNLKQWTFRSTFGPSGATGGQWECPDLLYVPGADGKGSGMWALKVGLNPGAPQGGSGEQYFLGSFDGKRFTPSDAPGSHGWTNYGEDDYCAISYNGLPRGEKPVLIGWMSNWRYAAKLPTSPWRGQMSLPRRLSLLKDEAGYALIQEPLIALLHMVNKPILIDSAANLSQVFASQETPYELDLQFDEPPQQTFGLRLYSDGQHWTEIGFDQQTAEFYIDRTHSGVDVTPEFGTRTSAPLIRSRPYDLRLIVDRSSVEAFVQKGTIAMTDLFYPISQTDKIEFFSVSGRPVAMKGQLWKLRSAWN